MRTRLSLCVAAGLVSIAMPSCNLTTSSPPDQNITEFCADWAKAICQIGNGPCDFDAATCSTYQTGVCTSFVSGQQGGTRAYSQVNGAACIQALDDVYGGNPASIPVSSLLNVDTICGRVVVGDQQTDQTCTTDSDCATNLVCAPTVVGGTSEVCAPVTTKQLGDICGDPGDQCEVDSYCAAQGAMQAALCVATPATGAACSATIPCGSTDTCSGEICVAAGGPGTTCSSNDQCASGYCDLYPPASCATPTNGLTFARGSYDCNGIEGVVGTGSTSTPDGGASDASAAAD
jgi:hypothetical protein